MPPAINLVHAPVSGANAALPEVPIRADRLTLAKRLWRGVADDGAEFGFELEHPLRHGDTAWASAAARYVIRQAAEPVLEIPLDVSPSAAALIGWAVGNLHFAVEAQEYRLLAPDDPALRQSLDRLGIHYHDAVEVFRPERFASGHSGHSHHHSVGDPHA